MLSNSTVRIWHHPTAAAAATEWLFARSALVDALAAAHAGASCAARRAAGRLDALTAADGAGITADAAGADARAGLHRARRIPEARAAAGKPCPARAASAGTACATAASTATPRTSAGTATTGPATATSTVSAEGYGRDCQQHRERHP